MANSERFYFYAPTWDYPPGGPIKLGNILATVKKPDRALSNCEPNNTSDVIISEKRSVEYTSEKIRNGGFSILTKWFSLIGLGVDISHELSKKEEKNFNFEKIETSQFIPDPEYLQRCLKDTHVQRFLEMSRYRKPVYIITGIKVVFGAEFATSHQRSRNNALAVEANGNVWSGGSVPVSGGPSVKEGIEKTQGTGWKGSSDFVFAYRVSKATVSKKKNEVLEESEYTQGAMLEDEALGFVSPRKFATRFDGIDTAGGTVETSEIFFTSIKELEAEGEGYNAIDVMEDGQPVKCIYLKREVDV